MKEAKLSASDCCLSDIEPELSTTRRMSAFGLPKEDVRLRFAVLGEYVGVDAQRVSRALQRHHVRHVGETLYRIDPHCPGVGAVVDWIVFHLEGNGRVARVDPQAAGGDRRRAHQDELATRREETSRIVRRGAEHPEA